MKNTDMLEWMNHLDVKYLNEAEQPVIHHTGKRRMAPALIAAAAAVAVMTAGVSAYIGRNTELLNDWFGANGENSVSEAGLPEPVVYENGRVRLTVETEIDDGVNHFMLLTAENPDGTPFALMNDETGYYPMYVGEDDLMVGENGRGGFCWEGSCSNLAEFVMHEDIAGQPSYMCFGMFGEGKDSENNPLRDIRIAVHSEVNTELADFETIDGFHMQLSCFELVSYENYPHADDHYMSPPRSTAPKKLFFKDGSSVELNPQGGGGQFLKDENGNDSDTYFYSVLGFDFLNVSEVTAIETDGVTYHRIS